MSCLIAQGSIYSCKARMSQVLCTCHHLALGVGPQANKGNNYVGEYKGELLVSLSRGKGKIQHSHNI